MDLALKKYLDKFKVNYKIHKHAAVSKVEESQRIKIKIPGLHCKTLFLKDESGRFYLIGMKAEKRLNMKIIRNYFNIKKIEFASPSELKENLNISPGSVSIFNLVNSRKSGKIILIIDKEVWDSEIVGFHPNINTETLEIAHKSLENYYNSLPSDKFIISL